MKKVICLIALAAISYGSVFAYQTTPVTQTTQQDTVKKTTSKKKGSKTKVKTKKMKKDTTTKM